MKFLITGAGGQLGQEWVRYLKSAGRSFAAYSSSEMDITNPEQVHSVFRETEPAVVINCAAYTHVDGAEEDEETAFKVNALGPEILAKECRRFRAKLVHFSTDYVFPGRKEDAERLPDGYPEDERRAPVNVYGKSKKEGEFAVEKSKTGWLIIRVSWLCGRYGNNFIKTMLRAGKEKKALDLVADQTGSPSFCFDVVEKTMVLIEMEKTGIYHISSSGKINWYQFARKIFKTSGIDIQLNPVTSERFPSKAKRPYFSLLNNSKIRDLGMEPIDWEKGTEEIINQINSDG